MKQTKVDYRKYTYLLSLSLYMCMLFTYFTHTQTYIYSYYTLKEAFNLVHTNEYFEQRKHFQKNNSSQHMALIETWCDLGSSPHLNQYILIHWWHKSSNCFRIFCSLAASQSLFAVPTPNPQKKVRLHRKPDLNIKTEGSFNFYVVWQIS